MSPKGEARKSERKRMLVAGKIIFNNKQSVYDCTVKDISEGGAKLTVANVLGLPKSFDLHIKKYDIKYPCDVVWRSRNDMGIKFDRRFNHNN